MAYNKFNPMELISWSFTLGQSSGELQGCYDVLARSIQEGPIKSDDGVLEYKVSQENALKIQQQLRLIIESMEP